MYVGNFSKVQLKPLLAGLAGLKATSYSNAGLGSGLAGLAGMGGSSPKTTLPVLKPPQVLALYEKGFSCSSFLAASISCLITFRGHS